MHLKLPGLSRMAAAGAVAIVGLAVQMPAAVTAAGNASQTYIVVYGSASKVDRAALTAGGNQILADLGPAGVMIVSSSNQAGLEALPGVTDVADDSLTVQIPDVSVETAAGIEGGGGLSCASTTKSCGLQWDLARIHVPDAWKTTQGSPNVKVAVLDTGLDSKHEEVGANYDVADSRSFVRPSKTCPLPDNPSSLEDFNGHGTWTATHVAGRNGPFMTGIAPNTTLVNVRVLNACGSGRFSWVFAGMFYANQIGASVVSMSLGGFVCADRVVPGSPYCGDPHAVKQGRALNRANSQLVDFMLDHGTVVIAAAGNNHALMQQDGRMVGPGLTFGNVFGPSPLNDMTGLFEVPGGAHNAVAVAALNRITAAGPNGSTRFGQYGVGTSDQLTYYSNFGQKVAVSAPGGARNFNVPAFDCLSGECARLANLPGALDNPGDFGAFGVGCTSCYAFIQGTSMATPQVAGVAALALAARPGTRADALIRLLQRATTSFTDANATPAISNDPGSPQFNYDIAYGTAGVSNQLMGSGVIDAALAVS